MQILFQFHLLMIVSRDIMLSVADFYVRYRTLPEPRTLSQYFNPCYATARLKPTFISKVRGTHNEYKPQSGAVENETNLNALTVVDIFVLKAFVIFSICVVFCVGGLRILDERIGPPCRESRHKEVMKVPFWFHYLPLVKTTYNKVVSFSSLNVTCKAIGESLFTIL